MDCLFVVIFGLCHDPTENAHLGSQLQSPLVIAAVQSLIIGMLHGFCPRYDLIRFFQQWVLSRLIPKPVSSAMRVQSTQIPMRGILKY